MPPTRRQWNKAKRLPRNFRRVTKTPYRKPTVKRIVRQVISRKSETKIRTYSWTNQGPVRGGGLSLPGVVSSEYGLSLPSLSSLLVLTQGTSQQTRIGNEITPKGLTLKGIVYSQPFDTSVNNSPFPFEVHMVMYRNKNDPNSGDPNKIKQLQSDAAGSINGFALNDMLPWNKDGYVIYKHRSWRLKPSPTYAIVTPASEEEEVGFPPEEIPLEPEADPTVRLIDPINSDFGSTSNKYFHRFSVKVPLPKKLKFVDGESTPSNFRMSMGFYIVNGDGQALPQSQIRAKVDLRANLYYTDQ